MNKIVKNAIILTVITLVSGLLLGFVYEITKDPIKEAKEKAKQEAYRAVLAEADRFEAVEVDEAKAEAALADAGLTGVTVNEAAAAMKGSETIGSVVTVTSHEGYGGDIQISVGVLADGTVTGIEILSIGETAGLGMKATEPKFKDQFKEKQVPQFAYTKSGAGAENEIDALSGATITTNAVTNAVNGALVYYYTEVGGSTNE